MGPTESQATTETKLTRITWLSARDHNKVFSCLMHHFNIENLKQCYQELDGGKATGIDKVDKERYGERLDENLKKLIVKMKQMSYRPGAVREVRIPKEGKRNATRSLGICNCEDKIVQKMMQKVLENIYEPLFANQSFGFRPNRGCHDAINALYKYLYQNQVEAIIDVDLENFYGTIDHKMLLEILGEKISDKRFIRYITRTLKLKTSAKKKCSKLERVNAWAKSVRNQALLKDIWKTFCSKLRGHIRYYGVSYNLKPVKAFICLSERILFKWLNKRSQRKTFTRLTAIDFFQRSGKCK